MTNYYDARTNVTVEHIAHPIRYHPDALELEIAWAERKTQLLISLDDIQRGYSASSFYDQRHFTNASELLQKVTTDHRYLLAIAISGHYFEN